MNNLYRKMFSSYIPYKVSSQSEKIILNANENSINLFHEFLDEATEKLKEIDVNRYPESSSYFLRKTYADYLDLEADNIICGNGSDEIIGILCNLFLENNEVAVGFYPSFSMYDFFVNVAKGRFVSVNSSKNDFICDVDELIELAKKEKAKLIFICNPNNPTGQVFSKEEIIKVIDESQSIVVVDEAYIEFAGESVVDLVNTYERLIVLRTLSKAFACAAMRVGFGVGSKELIGHMDMAKSPYNLNSFSQVMASLMIEKYDIIKPFIEETKKIRDDFYLFLQALPGVTVYPSGANFIFFTTSKNTELLGALKGNGISIREYADDLKDYLRISIGTREEMEIVKNICRSQLK